MPGLSYEAATAYSMQAGAAMAGVLPMVCSLVTSLQLNKWCIITAICRQTERLANSRAVQSVL